MDNVQTVYSPSLICLPRRHCSDQSQPQTISLRPQQQQPPQSVDTGIVHAMLYFNTGALAQGNKVVINQWCIQIFQTLQKPQPSA